MSFMKGDEAAGALSFPGLAESCEDTRRVKTTCEHLSRRPPNVRDGETPSAPESCRRTACHMIGTIRFSSLCVSISGGSSR